MTLTSDFPPSVVAARSLAVELGQGGALSLTKLDGNLLNAARIRVTTDGTYDFGTKPEGPAVLHDFCHTTYERGQVNTFNAGLADNVQFANNEADRIYDQVVTGNVPSVLISGSPAERHQHSSRAYRVGGHNGSIRRPMEFLRQGKNAGHRTMYFAAWAKYKQNSLLMRAVSDETTTGTFVEGETLVTNGGEFTGVYSYFDDDAFANIKHHLVIDNDRLPSPSELYGKT